MREGDYGNIVLITQFCGIWLRVACDRTIRYFWFGQLFYIGEFNDCFLHQQYVYRVGAGFCIHCFNHDHLDDLQYKLLNRNFPNESTFVSGKLREEFLRYYYAQWQKNESESTGSVGWCVSASWDRYQSKSADSGTLSVLNDELKIHL